MTKRCKCRNCHLLGNYEYFIIGLYCSHNCQINFLFYDSPGIIHNTITATIYNYDNYQNEYYENMIKNQQKIISSIQSQHKQRYDKWTNFSRLYLVKHLIKDIINIIFQY